MLDMGFIRDLKKILALLPKVRQNLLFSATFSNEIKGLTQGLLQNPLMIQVTPENTTVEKIEQQVYLLNKGQKTAALCELITENNWQQVLVFMPTKHEANRLSEQLTYAGIPSAALHGNKSQNARTKALADFKANELRVLVATDVAARGIDISQLPYVVNFALPRSPADYVHRIGRTGRAGKSGLAVSFVAPDEIPQLKLVERLIGIKLPSQTINPNPLPEAMVAIAKAPRPPRPVRKAPAEGAKPKNAGNKASVHAGQKSGQAQGQAQKTAQGQKPPRRFEAPKTPGIQTQAAGHMATPAAEHNNGNGQRRRFKPKPKTTA
jgi:ATP-dependent RNA helicase RhlE